MKKVINYLFMIPSLMAIAVFVLTYGICCMYHNPENGSSENVAAWWLLRVIMDSWGYFALSASIYLFTLDVKSFRELLFHLIGIAACAVSGNDLIDRYCGDTHFKPAYDSLIMLMAIYSIYKIYKQSCRNL